tara:strand:- start:743 stop:1051 length:309 start_codon:yes stop_codon:yes gene_type:complete
MIKDIWKTFRAIPKIFREFRKETKYIANLNNMEKKEGMVGTFLYVFETELMDTLPIEVLSIILLEFAKEYESKKEENYHEADSVNIPAFNAYCDKYGVKIAL